MKKPSRKNGSQFDQAGEEAVAQTNQPAKKQPTGDYEVGYCKPPVKSQFQPGRSGNPKGRPKKVRERPSQTIELVNEPVAMKIGSERRYIESFSAALINLALQAVVNKKLEAAIMFVDTCKEYRLVALPEEDKWHGLVVIPDDWDPEEFTAKLYAEGRPPWPGPRSGMALHTQVAYGQMTQADDKILREVRYPAMHKDGREVLVRQLANEVHEIVVDGKKVKRTVLELVLMRIRAKAFEGNARAFRYWHKLLKELGSSGSDRRPFWLVVGEDMSMEEWIRRYAKPPLEEKPGP